MPAHLIRAARSAVLGAVLVLVVALGCSSGDGGDDASPAATVPLELRVADIASTTGSGAVYGTSQVKGARLAARDLTGRKVAITLQTVDDASTEAGGVAAMTALLEERERPSVVLGPTLSPVAAAADPLAADAGVPVLGVTNATLDIEGLATTWRVSLREGIMVDAAVAAVKERHDVTTAALLVQAGDEYAAGAAAAFEASAQAQEIDVTTTVAVPLGGAEAAVLSALDTAPDAVFLAARSGAAVELLRGLEASAWTGPRVGSNGFNGIDVLTLAGDAADGLVVGSSWGPDDANAASRRFVRRYRDRFDTAPDAFAAQSYAGVQVALAAATKARSAAPDAIQTALGELGPVDTVLGRITFGRDREARYPPVVQEVRGGRLVAFTGD